MAGWDCVGFCFLLGSGKALMRAISRRSVNQGVTRFLRFLRLKDGLFKKAFADQAVQMFSYSF
jgi:hypothetical protein